MKDFTKSVFLTKDGFGITATSANYLANLSQEVIAEKRTSLENIKFLSSRIISPLCLFSKLTKSSKLGKFLLSCDNHC